MIVRRGDDLGVAAHLYCTNVHVNRVDGDGLRPTRPASRLYYELGETQNAIAEQLGVTRPQVSRLLKRARAEGVVEIRVVDRTSVESPAADALRERFGLGAVHLAPTIAGPRS
jgi:DNA-binding transcriptional regulator LsrR (DeoR family)